MSARDVLGAGQKKRPALMDPFTRRGPNGSGGGSGGFSTLLPEKQKPTPGYPEAGDCGPTKPTKVVA